MADITSSLMMLSRAVFGLLFISAIVLLISIRDEIQIDTDLAELSPQNQHNAANRAAIGELTSSIQQRIIFLVSGIDEDQVFDAHEALYKQLADFELLTVQPSSDELAEGLIEKLKPYRFSLLSEEQRQRLSSNDADTLAANAKQQLYQLTGPPRVYSFADDPLGWHSETLFELFSEPGSGLVSKDSSGLLSKGSSGLLSQQTTSLSIGLVINDGALNMTTQTQLSQRLNGVIGEIEQDFSVTIDTSGIFFFAAHAAKSSKQDISLISTGSSIGIILLLLFAFRSLSALILPFVSVALGVGFAFAVTHSLYGNVHILTIVFGASLIGIVIDYSLHFFYHRVYHGMTNNSALHRALLLSLMTSLIGYAALSFSSLAALQKVAVFSCCGLAMAWLSVVCLGNVSIRHNPTLEPNSSIFGKLVSLVSKVLSPFPRFFWPVIAICLIAVAAAINVLSQPFDDDPRVFFKPPTALLESERRVAEIANDYEPGRYIIVSGDTATQVYDRHTELFRQINRSTDLDAGDFTSLLNWIPNQAQQTQDYQLQNAIYGRDGAASILIDSLGNQEQNNNLTRRYTEARDRYLTSAKVKDMLGDALPPFWVETDQSIVNFVLIRKGVAADKLGEISDSLIGVEYVNSLARTRNALAEQRASAGGLLLLAYCLIAALILVRYRRIRALWLVAVPACSSAMLFILGSLFGFQLNLFHVMALFLVLGFGMDYTIFTHEMRTQISVTLQAILLSALTSLLSFGLLALSSIPVVASFGLTLLVGNLFNLLGAFVYSQASVSTRTANA